MVSDDAGQTVQTICNEIPQYYGGIDIDEFQIMLNHFHGIIRIMDDTVRAYFNTPLQPQFKSPSRTIGAIIRGFKSAVTKQINQIQNIPGLKLWQRNYGNDRFFIIEWEELRDIAISSYRKWLNKHDGVRPRKYYSLHCSISPSSLEKIEDR